MGRRDVVGMDKAAVSQGRASEGAGGGRDALVFGRTPIETARIRSIETRIVDLPLRRLQQFARFGTHLQSIVLVEILTEEIGRAHVELQSLMRTSYAVFCL